MSKTKLIASAAAAMTALTMMLPTAMSVSAVQIGTESQTVTEEPVTEEPKTESSSETESVTKKTEDTKQTKKTTAEKTQTQTKKTTETEAPTQTTEDTEVTTKKTKKTTKKTTTAAEETTTTSEEDKTSYHSASVELSHSGFDEDNEIKVKLKINSDARITKAKIYLDFDESILKYKSSKTNDEEIDGIASDKIADGRYTFEYENSNGTEYDGTYVTVTFGLKKTNADQTAVMTVIDDLEDEDGKDISANASTSNAIMTLPDSTDDDDDSSKDSKTDINERTYQPINLTLADKEIKLDSLGISDYKTIQTEDETIASVEDGKIIMHQAGECKMTVTYTDGSKGYFNLKIAGEAAGDGPAVSADETSSDSDKKVLSEDDSNSKKNTVKITVVIVIVCVALILLIIEYFILVAHRRKKQQQKHRSNSRNHRDYEDEDDDDDDDEEYGKRVYYTPRRLGAPEKAAAEEVDDSTQSFSYPTARREKVNDFEDFLSNDTSEDIKFTGSIRKVRDDVRPDIEDFTLSQNGFRND